MKLITYFEECYLADRLLGSSDATIEQYLCSIRYASRILKRDATLRDLNQTTVRTLINESPPDRTLGTVNRDLRHLAAIWNHAFEAGRVKDAPRRCRVKEPVQFKRAWSIDEIERILKSASLQKGNLHDIPASKWWMALLLTLYETGCRKTATLRIPMSNLDLSRKAVLVPGRYQKEKRDQWCGISDQTSDAIKEIMSPERERLFPWPFDKSKKRRLRTFDNHFKRILKRADIETEFGLFHRLRRSRASYGELMSPGSATQDLGHSDRAVTLKYLDPRICGISRVVDLIPRPQV